jgi:hypothetical protein
MSLSTRRALYGKLAGDTTLNNLLGAPATGYSKNIYYQVAPEGAAYPLIVFSKQAGTPTYTLKSGQSQMYLRRQSDIDYLEDDDGEVYRHAGSLYRLLYSQT